MKSDRAYLTWMLSPESSLAYGLEGVKVERITTSGQDLLPGLTRMAVLNIFASFQWE